MNCRHCGTEVTLLLMDLGSAPPSNAYLTPEKLHAPEKWFPLRVLVCEHCWLVQTEDFARAHELFDSDYAYFSGFSTSWLAHCKRYVDDMVRRFCLTARSHVVEVAANDGYLLQYIKARNIACTGIEPTASTAEAARAKGIEIVEAFFGVRLAERLVTQAKKADLMIANNVLAHVPNINDFVEGFQVLLKPQGVATFEFPHLLQLISNNLFDTIYHEHFSYLSLTAVKKIFDANGLTVFDVEQHPTHGGSLRVFAQRSDTGQQAVSSQVTELLSREKRVGVCTADYYAGFQGKAEKVKDDFLAFLLDAKRQGKTVAAYGAAAKGNTLINFAGIRGDLLRCVFDAAPSKQGKYMPGSRIPILSPDKLRKLRPDWVVILPWNLTEEIIRLHNYVSLDWGGRFIRAVPTLEVLPVVR